MHFIWGVGGENQKGQDRKCNQFSQIVFQKTTSANLQGCTAKDTGTPSTACGASLCQNGTTVCKIYSWKFT